MLLKKVKLLEMPAKILIGSAQIKLILKWKKKVKKFTDKKGKEDKKKTEKMKRANYLNYSFVFVINF